MPEIWQEDESAGARALGIAIIFSGFMLLVIAAVLRFWVLA